MAPAHVLVPLDGSQLASDALDHAIETFDCRITVLNVVTPLDGGMSEGSTFAVDQERIDDARTRADDLVDDARDRVGPMDQDVERVIETGDPSETILSYAETHDVDHVVMGGHGDEGSELKRRLLGTVSTAVVGEASVTVTVVR